MARIAPRRVTRGRSRSAWEGGQRGEPGDATLVAAAQIDRRAFAPLYDRDARPIYRYCFARLGTHEAAEGATAEVFLKAIAALDSYRQDAFAAWPFRIARNVAAEGVPDDLGRRDAGDPPG